MFCTAAIAETVIGKTLARKIRKIGAASLTPNHKIATGIQAIGEIGRRICRIGLKAWKARVYQPSSSPTGTPMSTASVNPHVTRKSDATMYLKSRPFCTSSMMPRRTLPGVGNKSLCEIRTARPHAVKNNASIPTARTVRQKRESGFRNQVDVLFFFTRSSGSELEITGQVRDGETPVRAGLAFPTLGTSALPEDLESALISLPAPNRKAAQRSRRSQTTRQCNPQNPLCR